MIDRRYARAVFNAATIAGLSVTALAFAQFLVFMALDSAGIVSVGNGLGIGLLLWFGVAVGAILTVVGVVVGHLRLSR